MVRVTFLKTLVLRILIKEIFMEFRTFKQQKKLWWRIWKLWQVRDVNSPRIIIKINVNYVVMIYMSS